MEILGNFLGNEFQIGPLVSIFLSCYFFVGDGIKLVLMCQLELNLDGTFVLGLELRLCLLFSSSTENQSMLSCFICKGNNIIKLLYKVTDRGKASMTKLLTETGDKASLEKFKKSLFYHASSKLRILNTLNASSRKRVHDEQEGSRKKSKDYAPKTKLPKLAKINAFCSMSLLLFISITPIL